MASLHKHNANPTAKQLRREFRKALTSSLCIVWPILSALLLIIIALGLLVGWREGWSIGDSLYFAFITGLTIGYGDLAPHAPATKILAVVIGFTGMLLTAVIAAQAVFALEKTARKTMGDNRGN